MKKQKRKEEEKPWHQRQQRAMGQPTESKKKKKRNPLIVTTRQEAKALEKTNRPVPSPEPERPRSDDGLDGEGFPPDNKWPKKRGKKSHNFAGWKYIDWHAPEGSPPMEW